jgi:glycosyltransferase involved in cell wall biosynthesis
MDNLFYIIVPVYNADKYILKCLESVNNQYRNYKVIIVNDCSTDSTRIIVENFIKDKSQFQLITNKVRNGSGLFSINKGIENINESDKDKAIIITLDGDDFLANSSVLNYLNEVYQNELIWMTYGNMEASNKQWSGILKEVVDPKTYRKTFQQWDLSHLRSFKYKLWDKINKVDLLDDKGEWYKLAWDVAFMLPMIEMAGKEHSKFINEILYTYNNENQLSDFILKPKEQVDTANLIKQKQSYDLLRSL